MMRSRGQEGLNITWPVFQNDAAALLYQADYSGVGDYPWFSLPPCLHCGDHPRPRARRHPA
eukprot:4981379-Lingulodinium_polyedra.AAC.1